MAVDVARIDPRVTAACERLLDSVDDIACASARIIRKEEPHYVDVMSFQELVEAVSPNIIGLVESVMVNETSRLAAPVLARRSQRVTHHRVAAADGDSSTNGSADVRILTRRAEDTPAPTTRPRPRRQHRTTPTAEPRLPRLWSGATNDLVLFVFTRRL